MPIRGTLSNACLLFFILLVMTDRGAALGSTMRYALQNDLPLRNPINSVKGLSREPVYVAGVGGLVHQEGVAQRRGSANLNTALFVPPLDKTTIVTPDESMQLEFDSADSDVQNIRKLIADKQLDQALKEVEALEKKQPRSAATLNLKGAVYLAKDDAENARNTFEQALRLEPTSAVAAMRLAQLDLSEKKPEAARNRFQAILAIDKSNVQAMLGLAGVAAATAQEAEYVAWLEQAAKAAPSAVRPYTLLSNYYLQKNDLQKALAITQEAQSVNPDNAEVLALLGTAQIAAGDTRNAVATFSKLARLFPNDPVAHYRLATAQAASQNTGAARASLNKALELKPDYLLAEILLASTELDAGNYREALKIAQRIQAQYPQSASGLALQGNILMAKKQFAPAVQAYEKAFDINKTGSLAVKVHQALSAAGNTKEADARLLQWLKDQPGDVTARAYLAALHLKAGREKQAVEQYQVLLQADPRNFRALNDLAWLYQKEKDPRALVAAEQGYQFWPDSPDIMDTLGWILVEQGNTARGLELLQKAAEKAPSSAEIRYHLAAALAKSGDKVQARQQLQDLLAKNKKFPQRQEAQALLNRL